MAILPLLLFAVLCSCCGNKKNTGSNAIVFIKNENGKYTLYKNGKPFFVQGGAGYTNLKELKNAGGNTIRIWDTTNLASVLDSAQKYNLSVIAGFWIPNSDQTSTFYKNRSKTDEQLRAIRSVINRFKNHPALLMWCVGNELDFPFKLSYNSFYRKFNNIVDMIHTDDPDHPVTTTVLNFNKKYIANLTLRTDVDIISFNMFGRITYLKEDLDSFSWFWKGPFMVTEWGVDGPWDSTAENAWGAYIELTSTKNAEIISSRYIKSMPVQYPGFLGSLLFYWGNKQEGTHTWFSMFTKNGARSEAVDAMTAIWTKKSFPHKAPRIRYMLLNKKGAMENVLLNAGERASAEVVLLQPDTSISKIEWAVYKEDWFKKNLEHNQKHASAIPGLIKNTNGLHADFTAPSKEGPYRIFFTVYNRQGYFATCNIPFYVLSNK